MSKVFEHDRIHGLICPWCTPKRFIDKCDHNPFQLMAQVDRLRAELETLEQAQRLVELIREIAVP